MGTPPIQPPQPPLSLQTPAPIQIAKYARNGLVPHAVFESELAASLNFAAAVRNKELFHYASGIAAIPTGDIVARDRWRFAAHTSPMLRKLRVRMLIAQQDHGGSGSPTCTVYITNVDGSTVYGQESATFGASASGTTDVPFNFSQADLEISGVPADTDVYGRFEDGADARLVAATVYEESLSILTANGYVVPSVVSVTAPIYDARRQSLYELATNLWKRGAAHLWNFTRDLQSSPFSTSSATPANVIDSATTGAASTSATLDLRYCRTRSTATVPCVLKVYAKMSGASDTGIVRISGANGGFIDSVNVTGTTAQWYSVSLDLDAAEDTFYVEGYNGSAGLETLSVYAFSLYQYAA